MVKEWRQNFRDLGELMQRLGRFTINGLLQQFSEEQLAKGHEGTRVSTHETARDYVERLAEQGSLIYENGGYSLN